MLTATLIIQYLLDFCSVFCSCAFYNGRFVHIFVDFGVGGS